jgi:hypothetical protein
VSKETVDSEEDEADEDTTVHPSDDLPAKEDQDEEVKAAEDSESEMSVVLDEAPKKQRKKSASTGTKAKAAPKAKATKAPAKPAKEETPDEAEIKRLQGWLVKCGIRTTHQKPRSSTSKRCSRMLAWMDVTLNQRPRPSRKEENSRPTWRLCKKEQSNGVMRVERRRRRESLTMPNRHPDLNAEQLRTASSTLAKMTMMMSNE